MIVVREIVELVHNLIPGFSGTRAAGGQELHDGRPTALSGRDFLVTRWRRGRGSPISSGSSSQGSRTKPTRTLQSQSFVASRQVLYSSPAEDCTSDSRKRRRSDQFFDHVITLLALVASVVLLDSTADWWTT